MKMTRTQEILTGIVMIILALGVFSWYLYDHSLLANFSLAGLRNPPPSLHGHVSYPAAFPQTARDQVTELRSKLRANQSDITSWLILASQYRAMGHNGSAVQIYNYLLSVTEGDPTILRTLGEYYFHIAKNYSKAEGYYRQAIAKNPALASAYTDLFEMYSTVYKKDSNAAVDVLKEGVSKVQGQDQIQLTIQLASYYRDQGDVANAHTYYTQAIALARKSGNTALVRQLTQTLSTLK